MFLHYAWTELESYSTKEFQTARAEHRNARSAKRVCVAAVSMKNGGGWGMLELMYIGSCMSGWRACSQCVGELAASVAVPGAVKTATVAVPAEQLVPWCSERAAASECCCLGHRATQRCSSPAETVGLWGCTPGWAPIPSSTDGGCVGWHERGKVCSCVGLHVMTWRRTFERTWTNRTL